MTQTSGLEQYNGQLTRTLTTTYRSGAISKRYLNAEGLPFEVVWVKPLPLRVIPQDVIEHREVQLYRYHYGNL